MISAALLCTCGFLGLGVGLWFPEGWMNERTADHSGAPSGSETGETTSTSPLLQMDRAWTIDPSELAVCQLSDGSDWLLGTGSFGAHFPPSETLPMLLASLLFPQ